MKHLIKKRVKGGRLGKMFASGIGAVVGGTTGNPFMSILGAEFGRRAQGNILESALGGDIAKSLEIPKELTEILATKVPRKDVIPPVVIPKKKDIGTLNLQSNKEGSLKTNQPTTTSIPIKAIPQTVLPIKEVSSKASVKTVIPESAFSKSNDLATEAKKYKSAEEFVEDFRNIKISKDELKQLSDRVIQENDLGDITKMTTEEKLPLIKKALTDIWKKANRTGESLGSITVKKEGRTTCKRNQ